MNQERVERITTVIKEIVPVLSKAGFKKHEIANVLATLANYLGIKLNIGTPVPTPQEWREGVRLFLDEWEAGLTSMPFDRTRLHQLYNGYLVWCGIKGITRKCRSTSLFSNEVKNWLPKLRDSRGAYVDPNSRVDTVPERPEDEELTIDLDGIQ